ncbi:hypothetical protein ACGFMM_00770 [Streptomyces sp. NPDC048604]|uniref:hypothetical protein n=1 Tax=Streptomyces sp. NPDC048604 TaxID=3365578 RepID=UPI0037138178
MRAFFVPTPPGGPPASPGGADPDGTGRGVRRAFLVVNAVPLAIGVMLSCAPVIAGVTVYGQLTLGVVWVFLQLGLFLTSTWWYEDRSTRLCAGVDEDTAGGPPSAGTTGMPSPRRPGR